MSLDVILVTESQAAQGTQRSSTPRVSPEAKVGCQFGVGSGGTGMGISVVIFQPAGVLIQSNTITNGLGTGSVPRTPQ